MSVDSSTSLWGSEAQRLRGGFNRRLLLAAFKLLAALEQTYQLSEARYRARLDGYLGVLVAQRSLYFSQQTGVALRLAEKANQVALYKALGGGS